MATGLAAPAVSLDGPLPLPPEYSLLRQAEVVEGDLRSLAGGAGIWAYPTTLGRLWAPCQVGTFAEKDLDEDQVSAEFAPFGLYLPVSCSLMGVTEDELRSRARTVFEAVESEAVERELATGTIQPTNPYLGDTNADVLAAGAAQKPYVALALLEKAIAATGRKGIIHADPGVTTMWALALENDGSQLRTIANNTLVISGDGYLDLHPVGESAATATQGWAFATGPVLVNRSPIEVLFSIDHALNDGVAMAERNYLVTWDTALQAAVRVDLTA